ncbi:hypothetical protein [Pseudonocardia sp. KRD291]|uniref:hypothetical protein n=1 Tax=Pseudonocardia sp. KRD291 TaxID=2792007 RepID=UPI001C4A03ED|nr:hypothetical protein [Pseudonocardia sp. KRD291]MBW0105921.1 hypothetical protein [Pseudonocardia sp. KRD291]
MLKKAGIVVAAGAATLLAMSPLAFAGDSGENGENGGHHGASNVAEKNSKGFVNVSGNNIDVSPQTCVGNVASGNNLIQGVLGLAGKDGLVKSSVENNQDQSVNCTNASQAGDNVEQSDGAGSDDSSWGSK